jgi:hypothetical protein
MWNLDELVNCHGRRMIVGLINCLGLDVGLSRGSDAQQAAEGRTRLDML